MLIALLFAGVILPGETIQFYRFKKSSGGVTGRKYWGGKSKVENGMLKLEATSFKGSFWGRVMVPRLKNSVNVTGRKFVLTVRVKGRGEFYPGFMISEIGKKGKYKYEYIKSEKPFILNSKLQKASFEFDFGERVPVSVAAIMEVRGENAHASVYDLKVEDAVEPGAVMESIAPYAAAVTGSDKIIRQFKFSIPDETVQIIKVSSVKGAAVESEALISDEKGLISAGSGKIESGLNKVIATAKGAAAVSFVDGLSAEKFAELDRIAKKVSAGKAINILYLGDSINDYNRGCNAVDRLSFWLNKHNPGKFNFYNYSVAGDTVVRIYQRLNGGDKRRLKRYNGMFDRKYDMVIIACGNNETYSTSATDFKTPAVALDIAQKDTENIISFVRQKAGADIPVMLLSGICGDSARLSKKCEINIKRGRVGVRFGDADKVNAFGKMLEKIAANGKNITFTDMYNPMKAAFAPENYADGLHLNPGGHQVFAEILLKVFAEKK